ncbi:MAG: hypothetical protein IKC27_00925, partial [Kiritimatiellae bacterium]|nr:hypothetical protein [Kiritimatiellia bacterium]
RWVILFSSFHHTTNCDAFVIFSRDAPMGAFLPTFFLLLSFLVSFLLSILSPPRQLAFPI